MRSFAEVFEDWSRKRQVKKTNRLKTEVLLTFLNSADQEQKATLLAMATVFRSRVIDRSEQLSGTLYNPMQSADKKRRLIFELLQAVQNKMQDEMKTVKSQLKKLQLTPDSQPQEHWELSILGMDLWLITLGATIDNNQLANLKHIWQQLDSAADGLPETIKRLRLLEEAGHDPSHTMFGDIDDQTWLEKSHYRPAWF
ncbi:hypothetical protein [Alkalimarinus sediminis]|uniref:Uncharacterized protein n=1 Tax=Alkalimarinus sediminis TaxID=1632866 RepID=A0A9E8KP99_9ALTE|nr:hypothetical protein [Alkalimarinus sediminis]UZW75203.1 hypothetical protein NNL22_00930 [Alkalimarinus sediminis]